MTNMTPPLRRLQRGRRGLFAATLASLALLPAGSLLPGSEAHAQQLGGSVNSTIAVLIGTPTAFTRIRPGAYELQIPVSVSSTLDDTRLSIADGEDYAAPARGVLHAGSRLITRPLDVFALGGTPTSLASPVDPVLKRWATPIAQQPATIVVRQHVRPNVVLGDSVRKILLVTLSTATP